MALKLEYAHYILNGVVTENFHLVEANAEKLSKLSQAEAWSELPPEIQARAGLRGWVMG
jgi:hypothetical protein